MVCACEVSPVHSPHEATLSGALAFHGWDKLKLVSPSVGKGRHGNRRRLWMYGIFGDDLTIAVAVCL